MPYKRIPKTPGLTCREMLPQWYGKHIKIGFNKGSSFVFCNVCNEGTEQELERVEDKIRKEMLRNIETATSKLKTLQTIGVEGFIIKMYGRDYFPPPHKRVQAAEAYYAQMRSAERGIKKYTELSKGDGRGMILEARYLESYPSTDPTLPDTLIVILEGDINGKYWFEEEYLTGHVAQDDRRESDEDD